MIHTRWRRRALALWMGLAATWAAAVAAEYIRFRELFLPALAVTSAVALLVGIVGTLRIRSQDEEPFITVQDLHRR